MLAGVTLDLSAYAADFGKHLASMFHTVLTHCNQCCSGIEWFYEISFE